MNVIARTPFRILKAHGVEPEQIEVLERRFGPRFPGVVVGPNDALVWGLSVLPWPAVAPILRTWLERGQERASIALDLRARRARALLVPEPSEPATLEVGNEVNDLLEVLARLRGIKMDTGVSAEDPNMCDDYRAWAATLAAVQAAHVLVCTHHQHTDRAGLALLASFKTLDWVLTLFPENAREMTLDRMIRDVMAAVAEFVGSWVIGSGAKN